MVLIEAKDVEKTYSDGTRALRGISLDIKEGEFVAIMGPSGSGKSTLLHILGFLDGSTGGVYKFNEKTFYDYTNDEISKTRNSDMGFVFQMFNLLAKTSVLDNVKLPLVYAGIYDPERTKLAKKAIDSVGLSHRENHHSNELSGGEKQRVAIARALVTKPKIIFADEPTGNLDSKTGQQIMEILADLNKNEGKTIVLITHEKQTASYAHRVVGLLDGKIDKDILVKEGVDFDLYLK
jgi:putative ABC transport system ATP-binding protein